MSTIFVDENGFHKKTEAELVAEFEVAFQGIFGSDVDLDPLGPFGQLIAFLAKAFADMYDGAEEIYTARNPAQATGTSLDYISYETGITRLDSSPTLVENVVLYGTDTTVVPLGVQVKQPNTSTLFSLLSATTIDSGAFRDIIISLDSPGTGDEVSFEVDDWGISYIVQAGDTNAQIIQSLITAIGLTTYDGTAEAYGDNLDQLRLYDFSQDRALTNLAFCSIASVGSAGVFEATDNGAVVVPVGYLNTIVTPTSGWDSVYNPYVGTTGRDVETDQELRIRRAAAWSALKGSDSAIKYYLLQYVSGVTSAEVTSNRTDTTDSEGRPGHSFEAVVEGGIAADIAEAIWDVMPAGIQAYGTTETDIVDSEGFTQTIGWSRPTNQYIWVKVRRDLYNEETYPTDGDTLIKEAIVNWSLTEFVSGKDVIPQRLNIPIYTVPGVGQIEVTVDATDLPTDTPTYASDTIPIAGRELAVFDATRIIVEDLN